MINYKEFLQSLMFKKILFGIGALIIALAIFQAGVFVGYHKAAFSYTWGNNYYRAFGKPERGFKELRRGEFSNAHGTIGKIVKITLPTIVIEERDNVEKIVAIKDDTTILRFREKLKPVDLNIDDMVVVVGSPNEKSEVEAKVIRVIPAPDAGVVGTSTPRPW